MIRDGKIWIANGENGEPLYILPDKANRHGLIAGATGTGKTVTLKVMAESFSEIGVPVFMADVKGDLAGIMAPGEDTDSVRERVSEMNLADQGYAHDGYPVTLWDIFGKNGIPLRTTISEIGPILLARVLDLNDLQRDILSIVYRIADENNLLLIDIKDLKAMLNYVSENAKLFEQDYGRISNASIGAIMRALVSLEIDGGNEFFGTPALNVSDMLAVGMYGKGMINILDCQTLINNSRLYSTFLLWLLSELYEMLPEVGDLSKPKLVFFFDEAHLLFNNCPKYLLEKIEQIVRLIRSKGVGVYFCTQNPSDVPNSVLTQLNNKIQHGLRAYTPYDQRAIRAAADSFRVNPQFSTYDTILGLGTGEAVISFLDADGVPGVCEKGRVLPPKSRMGGISDVERGNSIKENLAYSRYAVSTDPDSAYEFLQRKGMADKAAAESEAQVQQVSAKKSTVSRQTDSADKEALAKKAANTKTIQKAAKSVSNSIAGTIGREAGKALGSNFGSFGKTLGGNVGASLGRGIVGTLFGWKK